MHSTPRRPKKEGRPQFINFPPRLPVASTREDLRTILAEARDESPLQEYLTRQPGFFLRLLPPGRELRLWDRTRLGSEYVPDFLLSVTNSRGLQWSGIELESPTARPLTRAGEVAAKLNHAIGQIQDWRAWLRENIAYADRELGLKGISADFQAYIIIGRREEMNEMQQRRYRELEGLGIHVMSYDRLLD